MRLPPLNALRAFEAAARHEGYIAAAEELHVTRGAISRQIKLLEDHIGVPLFRRHARGVTLNDAGKKLLPILTAAFKDMSDGVERVAARRSGLRIMCPPATSIRWLMPRLDDFRSRHPEIGLQVTTDYYDRRGFDPTMYDLGISVEHWHDRGPDTVIQPLSPVVISPACTPEIAARLKTPADLANVWLLHERQERTDWSIWLDAYPTPGVDLNTGDVFHNLDMAIKAAEIGTGVVMIDLLLGRRELELGTLVMPFPDLLTDTSYGRFALMGSKGTWDDPDVAAFRQWLSELSEADTKAVFAGTPYA